MEELAAGPLEDPGGAQLLVRDAQPADQALVAALFGRAGWTGNELDRAGDANTLVLYDPADGVVRGAVMAGELAAGSFRLVAWAVHGVSDHAAATTRLLRAAADRLRRSGAERLVATLRAPAAAIEVFTDAGFGVVPSDPGSDRVVLYQEL